MHGLVDWDWDIPGVTVPALHVPRRAGGVAAAPARRPATSRATGTRGALLGLACVVAGLIVVSAGLPMLADQKASDAQAVSANAGAGELQHAAAEADLAARLDPTSVRPLLASAAIAEGRGRLLDSRGFLLDAVDRQPYSVVAWQRLLELALKTADRQGARAAASRLLELDPIGSGTLALTGRLVLFEVPAASSPTATGTPLSPRYNAGPLVAPAPGTARHAAAAGRRRRYRRTPPRCARSRARRSARSSIATCSSTACASRMPRGPNMRHGMPRSRYRRMSVA